MEFQTYKEHVHHSGTISEADIWKFQHLELHRCDAVDEDWFSNKTDINIVYVVYGSNDVCSIAAAPAYIAFVVDDLLRCFDAWCSDGLSIPLVDNVGNSVMSAYKCNGSTTVVDEHNVNARNKFFPELIPLL